MSENSRTVDKIARGERLVSKGISEDLVQLLQRKAEMINQTLNYLESPEKSKIQLLQAELSIVSFDINGVRVLNVFEEHGPYSKIGVLLNNADIGLPTTEYEFQSEIIALAAQEALAQNNQSILIQAIEQYFDTQLVGLDDWLVNNE